MDDVELIQKVQQLSRDQALEAASFVADAITEGKTARDRR